MMDTLPWQIGLPLAAILWTIWIAQVARAGRDRD